MRRLLLSIAISLVALAGCSSAGSGEVTVGDMEKNKREFSQEAYEEAMKKAGRADELEAEKQRAAERMGQQ